MQTEKELSRLKMTRLDITISPIHERRMEDEIRQAELKGLRLTKSEIIRRELDGRYLSKRRKEDSTR